MTCVVSWIQDGNVYMGGDSGASDGTLEVTLDNPKVVYNAQTKMMFGLTASYRMAQLLQYELNVPKQTQKDDLTYLIKQVVPAIRKCFAEGGFIQKVEEVEYGGFFLVGYKSKAYTIQRDFSVIVPTDPYSALGSGYVIASGALSALSNCGHMTVVEKLFTALRAAEKHLECIRPPYTIIKIDSKGALAESYQEKK